MSHNGASHRPVLSGVHRTARRALCSIHSILNILGAYARQNHNRRPSGDQTSRNRPNTVWSRQRPKCRARTSVPTRSVRQSQGQTEGPQEPEHRPPGHAQRPRLRRAPQPENHGQHAAPRRGVPGHPASGDRQRHHDRGDEHRRPPQDPQGRSGLAGQVRLRHEGRRHQQRPARQRQPVRRARAEDLRKLANEEE